MYFEGELCAICLEECAQVYNAPCNHKPEEVPTTTPIGMYHCPDCGAMVVAGFAHPEICGPCRAALVGEAERGAVSRPE